MRSITITLNPKGTSYVTKRSEVFETENYATVLTVDYSQADYLEDFFKHVDFKMVDGSTITLPQVGAGTLDQIQTIDITNAVTQIGNLMVQPYAIKDVGGVIHKVLFQPLTFYVRDAINAVNDAGVNPDNLLLLTAVVEQMQLDLDGKAPLVHTHDDRYYTESEVTALIAPKMNLNGSNSNIDKLVFNVATADASPLLEGQLRWNAIDKTLDAGMDGDGIVQQIGMETYYPRCRNNGAVAIADGDLVMYNGAQGNSGVIYVVKASPTMALPGLAMGVATEAIPVGADGRITWFGLVRQINTTGSLYGETWVDGQTLYNHATIAGGLSKTKPPAPKSAVMVGIVVNASNSGILFIRPQYFPMLEHLSNVLIVAPQDGDILAYDGVNQRWYNKHAT